MDNFSFWLLDWVINYNSQKKPLKENNYKTVIISSAMILSQAVFVD